MTSLAPSPVDASTAARQAGGSSFSAGMRVLPRAEREAMYAVYAFCRAVDDIADDQAGAPADRTAALDGWRRDLDALYAGRDGGRATLLTDAVPRFGLERADFEAVIDGMQMDVDGPVVAPDDAVLDLYCDRVASAVGRLSVRIFGMERAPGRELAHHLGRALQLTNILRDLDEDAGIGRLYLPREGLERVGIPVTTPREVVDHPEVDAAARALAGRAQMHYAEAAKVLCARPAGRLLAPRLMEAVYSRILRRMQRVGWRAPRPRVRVGKPELLWLVATRAVMR